ERRDGWSYNKGDMYEVSHKKRNGKCATASALKFAKPLLKRRGVVYLQALRRPSQFKCGVRFSVLNDTYLGSEMSSRIYSPQRRAKALDGIMVIKWLPENGLEALMCSKCSSFRFTAVTIRESIRPLENRARLAGFRGRLARDIIVRHPFLLEHLCLAQNKNYSKSFHKFVLARGVCGPDWVGFG
ncbi:hypothetical protein L195_g043149, partial [Trifolium pratense]